MKNVPVWVQTPSYRARPAVPAGLEPFQSDNEEKVRQALAMLPHFTVFDDIESRVEGAKVILSGRVTNPEDREFAGILASGVSGVDSVVNHLEVGAD